MPMSQPFAVEALGGEPWVVLPDAKALAEWGAEEEVAYNQALLQTTKARFYQMAFQFLSINGIPGDYHEYGCHRARTFRMALSEARRHRMEGMHFFAFDSFEGLPEPSGTPGLPVWTKGALRTGEEDFLELIRAHGLYVDWVHTVPGFYRDSLSAARRQECLDARGPIAMATVDCDLYESAVPVFEFIEPLLQEGSLVYLDDLFVGHRGVPTRGVARAFGEFRSRSRWRFARHLDVGWWGRSYIAYRGEGNGHDDL